MPDLPEHEERRVRDYVNSQSPPNDQATLVQKVGSKRILGRVYEMYDVYCEDSRWWVISDPMNLYDQEAFPESEQALIFHLGLSAFLAQRSRTDLPEEREDHVLGPWRRFEQAVDAMNAATEAEDFQAIGIKCREALLALVHDHAADEWVGEIAAPPKKSDFKGWGDIFAEKLADGRVRAYVKALVEKTWDLAVWLQHYADATPADAEIVLDATSHLLGTLGMLLHRRESGPPERCPRCGSYALDEDNQVVEEPESGFLTSTACRSCEWHSEPVFTSFGEDFADADIEGYLSRPAEGPSDRLPPKKRRQRPSRDSRD